jgi:Ni,Fe-hydrogenase maturation factor
MTDETPDPSPADPDGPDSPADVDAFEGFDDLDDPERHHISGEHRAEGSGLGSLFGDVTEGRAEETFGTEPGLIAGTRDDPVLVAGVGYPLLSDLALGTVLAHRVAEWDLPGVAVADLSHTPVAAYQTVSEGDYRTVLLVGAEKRDGELNDGTPSADPGAIHEYAPNAVAMPEEGLTELVGQSAMGFNTIENVVVVTRALGSFPEDTRVIAVEPAYDSWGMNVDEFSEPVNDARDEVEERLLDYLDDALV